MRAFDVAQFQQIFGDGRSRDIVAIGARTNGRPQRTPKPKFKLGQPPQSRSGRQENIPQPEFAKSRLASRLLADRENF
jgi:hypothetical protein